MEGKITTTCTSQLLTTMGLPCAHKIKCRMEESKGLYLTDIHSQWRTDFQDLDNVVLEGNNHGLVNDEQDEFQDEEDEGNQLVSPIPSIRVASVSFLTEHPPRS